MNPQLQFAIYLAGVGATILFCVLSQRRGWIYRWTYPLADEGDSDADKGPPLVVIMVVWPLAAALCGAVLIYDGLDRLATPPKRKSVPAGVSSLPGDPPA